MHIIIPTIEIIKGILLSVSLKNKVTHVSSIPIPIVIKDLFPSLDVTAVINTSFIDIINNLQFGYIVQETFYETSPAQYLNLEQN